MMAEEGSRLRAGAPQRLCACIHKWLRCTGRAAGFSVRISGSGAARGAGTTPSEERPVGVGDPRLRMESGVDDHGSPPRAGGQVSEQQGEGDPA